MPPTAAANRVSTYNDDDVPVGARQTQPADWEAYESNLLANRTRRTRRALQQVLGGELEEQPRVAVAFSGGGWRALTSGVAFLDALATPLSEIVPHAPEGFKVIDSITHAVGLSGGSWALATAIASSERMNPYHVNTTPNASSEEGRAGVEATTTTNEKRAPSPLPANPWLYGTNNHFDPSIHTYEGLKYMLSLENVNTALAYNDNRHDGCDGAASRTVNSGNKAAGVRKFFQKILPFDTTAMLAMAGEGTKAEAWGIFVANNILSFLNRPQTDGGEVNPSAVAVRASESSLKKKLSSMRPIIADGDFPLVICSAIADREEPPASSSPTAAVGATSSSSRAAALHHHRRRFDWVEVSPFYLRNPTTRHFTEDVDNAGVYFTKGTSHRQLGGLPPDARRYDLRLHQVMGMCGSAFALDREVIVANLPFKGKVASAGEAAARARRKLAAFGSRFKGKLGGGEVGEGASNEDAPQEGPAAAEREGDAGGAVDDKDAVSTRALVGGTLTTIAYGPHPRAITNTCRDAGLDFNIPFPAVFKGSSGRSFDIVIAMDAGMGSTGAFELTEAVRLGYVELVGELDPSTGDLLPLPQVVFGAKASSSPQGARNAEEEEEAFINNPSAPPLSPSHGAGGDEGAHGAVVNVSASPPPAIHSSHSPPLSVNTAHAVFGEGVRVKVYLAADDTVIIYFLGLTKRSTLDVLCEPADVEYDVASVRAAAVEVQKIFYQCIQRFASRRTRRGNASNNTANDYPPSHHIQQHHGGVHEEDNNDSVVVAMNPLYSPAAADEDRRQQEHQQGHQHEQDHQAKKAETAALQQPPANSTTTTPTTATSPSAAQQAMDNGTVAASGGGGGGGGANHQQQRQQRSDLLHQKDQGDSCCTVQ